jgi:AP-2 complex subunit sigma-1
VDVNDNELLLMETIHFFVEFLDLYFGNVCELDIIFHFNKVYMALDEFILAGEVQETSKDVILKRVKELERMD